MLVSECPALGEGLHQSIKHSLRRSTADRPSKVLEQRELP